MAFDWSDYLVLSDWLMGEGIAPSDEAKYRSAISRAYYAAFHSGMGLLIRKKEFVPSGEGTDHGAVLRVYQRHTSPKISAFAARPMTATAQ